MGKTFHATKPVSAALAAAAGAGMSLDQLGDSGDARGSLERSRPRADNGSRARLCGSGRARTATVSGAARCGFAVGARRGSGSPTGCGTRAAPVVGYRRQQRRRSRRRRAA